MKYFDLRSLLAENECRRDYELAAQAYTLGFLAAGSVTRCSISVCGNQGIFGTWFEPGLHLPGRNGQSLVGLVLLAVRGYERRAGITRYANGWASFTSLTECILANALRGHFYRQQAWIAYNATTGAYWDHPRWINGRSLRQAVARLAEIGLLQSVKGQKGVAKSVFRSGPQLLLLAEACRIESSDIDLRPTRPANLIILRNEDKEQIAYQPNAQTSDWSAQLVEYVRFMRQHTVTLDLRPCEETDFVQALNAKRRGEDSQPALVRPEFFRRYPCRIFSNASWEHGGRMYRTFWQEIPSEWRKRLRIDDQPTIELDYSALLPRMIYHQKLGIDYPAEQDPYRTDELTLYAIEQGLDPDHYRASLKTVLAALLNARASDKGLPGYECRRDFLPRYTLKQVHGQLASMHPGLGQFFRTGIGLRMQRLDSDIALGVLGRLKDRGVLALAVHDSFIVKATEQALLYDAMRQVYRQTVGFDPVIKQS